MESSIQKFILVSGKQELPTFLLREVVIERKLTSGFQQFFHCYYFSVYFYSLDAQTNSYERTNKFLI